jgi:uncharacterized ferritin-like protein (DUF455 family)
VSGQRRSLTPALFGPEPARDPRFRVEELWDDCENLPRDHPRKDVEFLHRQMNEEVNGIENSARCLADFPDADWSLRMQIARQCWDEARHVVLFRRLLEARGGRVGEYPVLNFQYRIISRIESLAGRLAVQNRSFEAEGIDAISYGVDDARSRGDQAMADLYEGQLADEITHVRYANDWLRVAVREDPRNVLRIARALDESAKAFREVMGEHGTDVSHYGVDPGGRLEAGFLPDEVQAAVDAERAERKAAAAD